MAENTDEEHLDTQTKTQSENFSDEIIAANDTKAINPNQETENMETHPQELHKAPGHGLKHYLFEFLMLFLAVFCGFLAENYRESRAEHQRAHELVISLIEDLQHDTAQLNMLIKFREVKKLNLDSLNVMLQSPPEAIDRNSFYRTLTFSSSFYLFSQSFGTISQLKNAGYLRYFSDNNLLRNISNYEFYVQDYRGDEANEGRWLTDKLGDFITFDMDNSIIKEFLIENNRPDGTGISFTKPDGMRNLKAIINQLILFNHIILNKQAPKLKNEAVKLMDYLHQQYQLK